MDSLAPAPPTSAWRSVPLPLPPHPTPPFPFKVPDSVAIDSTGDGTVDSVVPIDEAPPGSLPDDVEV